MAPSRPAWLHFSGRHTSRSPARGRRRCLQRPHLRPLRLPPRRRVVRRATPATLTGVNGRPTLACALSTATEGTPPGDQFIDARVPKARVAVASNACLMLIFLIATSCAEQANDNDPRSAGLI